MIAITNQAGDSLHLMPGQSLTLEQAAGWLADDELPGAFSYPIAFPLNDNNDRFLQFGYRPDVAVPSMELPVTALADGVLYRRCTLSYRIQDGRGDGFLKIDAGEVYQRIKQLSLLDVLSEPLHLGDGAAGVGISLAARMRAIAEMNPGEYPCTFFPIRNELVFDAELAGQVPGFTAQPYLNAWRAGSFQTDTVLRRGYAVAPQFYLTWVLERIFAQANYRIVGDWFGHPETRRICILNLTALRQRVTPVTTLIGHSVVPGLCVPNLSVPDFLKAVRQRYGLLFSFNANEQIVSLRPFSQAITQTPQDLSAFLLAGYSIDAPDGRGYAVADAIDEADELFKPDPQKPAIKPDPMRVGNGEQSLTLKAGSPLMVYENSPTANARWTLPIVRQRGNLLDEAYQMSDRYAKPDSVSGQLSRPNDWGLRFVSYRGMQPDTLGAVYPLATTDGRNARQEMLPGARATAFGGRAGLYRTELRNYYQFRSQTRPAVATLLLPAPELARLQLDAPVVLGLGGGNRRLYLPDRYQATQPAGDGLVKMRLKLLTLPDGVDTSPDYDEPRIWVELLQVTRTNPGAVTGSNPQNGRRFTKLTLQCWADQARSQPAVAQSLPVTLRVVQKGEGSAGIIPDNPGSSGYNFRPAQETYPTYFIVGRSQVIETDLPTLQVYGNDGQFDIFERFVSLAPGDGYNIL